ncbi:hypothetical protein GW17_00022859 [Ensete ventricosum]|nr:hypothetical protein GW17_00022859 [Ensete ventricosum]
MFCSGAYLVINEQSRYLRKKMCHANVLFLVFDEMHPQGFPNLFSSILGAEWVLCRRAENCDVETVALEVEDEPVEVDPSP